MRDPRQYTVKLMGAVDSGAITQDTVIKACMSYMSEADVQEMIQMNDLFDVEEEENEGES